jgi:predicted NBD/HSP70 family sugar kinase
MSDEASSALPPRAHLDQVVRSLVRHLPDQLAGLLSHGRFTDGAAAMGRLGDDAEWPALLAALGDDEAAWLAEVILERWSALADVVLDPVAAIVAPPEVWIGGEPVRIPVRVSVVGAEPGWETAWDGAAAIDAARAVAVAAPGVASVVCRAHVRARTAAGRTALTAVARIAVRQPSVSVREDLRRFVVSDQTGAPGVGVTLRIGERDHVTGPGGLVELDEPAARGAALRVEGVLAGRIGRDPGGPDPSSDR